MPDSRLPTEVELIYEVMPCNALRVAQEPTDELHPCTYFRKWGTYHSYDYEIEGVPDGRGVLFESVYVGRAPLVPEALSGCRKAPILSVGINPNLPSWRPTKRNTVYPLFDDYHQYAHYFRYRAVDKVEIPMADYQRFGGGGADDTPFTDFELNVPEDENGKRTIPVERQAQSMYLAYQGILDDLAAAMGWGDHALAVGEDLSYGNMIATPSAKWLTKPDPNNPTMPVMTDAEAKGIVAECWGKRRYFIRQLFQSLPKIVFVFSKSTSKPFIAEFHDQFTAGAPDPEETPQQLMQREIRLGYGQAQDGTPLDARVLFGPHPTGDKPHWEAARPEFMEQLVGEARRGTLELNPDTKHLKRSRGACVLCPMLQIGSCDYVDELQPLTAPDELRFAKITADSPVEDLRTEKDVQQSLMGDLADRRPSLDVWAAVNEPDEFDAVPE